MTNNIRILNSLLNSDDVGSLLVWCSEHADNPKYGINSVLRIFSTLLDKKDVVSIRMLLKYITTDNMNNSQIKSFGVLMLRYHILQDDTEKASTLFLQLYPKNTRKKHLFLLIEKYISNGNYESAVEWYLSYMKSYVVEADDINIFFDIPYSYKIFDTVVGYPITFENKEYDIFDPIINTGIIQLIELSQHERDLIILVIQNTVGKNRQQEFYTYINSLKYTKYDFVIDGANILFSGSDKINYNSYIRLDTLIKYLFNHHPNKRIQLVLHNRHFKNLSNVYWGEDVHKIIQTWKNVDILQTPNGLNDDYFSILSSVYSNSKIITNDKFRDHILIIMNQMTSSSLNIFKIWCLENTITYNFTDYTNICLNYPPPYSMRIQKIDNYYYFPTKKGTFLKFIKK